MRRAKLIGASIGVGSLVAGSVGGCTLIFSVDDFATDSEKSQPCQHAVPPAAPLAAEAGGDIEFVVAVQAVDFGDLKPPSDKRLDPTLGFDLDRNCSCCGCPVEGYTCLSTSVMCDDSAGVDHEGNKFILDLANDAVVGSLFSSRVWNAKIQSGARTTLLRVRHYNGTPNDKQVEVDWYITGPYAEGNDGGAAPSWDGADRWPIQSSCLQPDGGVDDPRFADGHAYVSDGILVVSLPRGVLPLSDTYTIDFTMGFLTARVVAKDAGQWELADGLIGALWKVQDIFAELSDIRLAKNVPLCTDLAFYRTIKGNICQHLDSYAGVDPLTPTMPCNSTSVGARIQTRSAQMGSELPAGTAREAGCPASLDPANDSCDP